MWRRHSLQHVHPDRRFPKPLPDGALDDWEAPAVLIAHGEDSVFPADPMVDRARQMIPNLRDIVVADAFNHMPPFAAERQAPFLDRIADFMRQS